MLRTILGEVSLQSMLLLVACISLLFMVPLFPAEFQNLLYLLNHLLLLIISTYMVEHKRNRYLIAAIILSTLLIAAKFMTWHRLEIFVGSLMVLFFVAVALILIKQVLYKKPGLEMILQAIGGYLLFGIALVFVMTEIIALVPNSFLMNGIPLQFSQGQFTNNSYFVFITYTTVGYGDVLPNNDIARAFAKFVALSGQIYNSVIVAILVGKYLMVEQSKNTRGEAN